MPPARALALRFGVVYLGLFCLATQLSGSLLPNLLVEYRGLGRLPPLRGATDWVGATVFGIPFPLDPGQDGEPLFFWIQLSWLVVVASLAAIAWSLLDRRRRHDSTIYAWFHLAVRLVLAASLVEYGMTKVIPTQFPAPSFSTLVTPVGDLTSSALLWTTIGSAQPYQILSGCVELLAAALLIAPRTATLGALLGFGALLQVLALNLTYDVGLKMTTMHLVALAAIVLARDAGRFADFLLARRPAVVAPSPTVGRTNRAARIVLVAQLAFGVYLFATYAYINWSFWQVAGGGRPAPALYGIWDVERLVVNGQSGPVDQHDYDRRWRRVIVEAPNEIIFQRTDDSLARYGASFDDARGALSLTKGNSRTWRTVFNVRRNSPDELTIEGTMDGQQIDARLRRVDLASLRLLNSTFRWVRPHER
jgi:hypothetical protein